MMPAQDEFLVVFFEITRQRDEDEVDFLRIPRPTKAFLNGGSLDDNRNIAIKLDRARHVQDSNTWIVREYRFYDRTGLIIVKESDGCNLRHLGISLS